MMVSRGIMEGGAVSVDVKNGEFDFDVRKGPIRSHGARARATVRA